MKIDKRISVSSSLSEDSIIRGLYCNIEVEVGESLKDLLEEVFKCFDEYIWDITVKVNGKDDRILKVHRPSDWEENREQYIEKMNEQLN